MSMLCLDGTGHNKQRKPERRLPLGLESYIVASVDGSKAYVIFASLTYLKLRGIANCVSPPTKSNVTKKKS